jgi:hypothetical protein
MTYGAIIENANWKEACVAIPLISIFHPIVLIVLIWFAIDVILANYKVRKKYKNQKRNEN